jgi:hypothetical protein
LPIPIHSFELVPEANLLWQGETEGSVVYFKISGERRQPQARLELVHFAIGDGLAGVNCARGLNKNQQGKERLQGCDVTAGSRC